MPMAGGGGSGGSETELLGVAEMSVRDADGNTFVCSSSFLLRAAMRALTASLEMVASGIPTRWELADISWLELEEDDEGICDCDDDGEGAKGEVN